MSITARDLLTRAVEQGGPSDTALVFLDRLNRVSGPATLDAPRGIAAGRSTIETAAPPQARRAAGWLPTTLASVIAGRSACSPACCRWCRGSPTRQRPPAAAPERTAVEPLPVVRSSEIVLDRARSLYLDGHLRDALRALERIDVADPVRPEADRLRADVQRALLAAATGRAQPTARCAPVKCPKCAYLGFETGDRCKNCGYDFSLMAASSAPAVQIDLPADSPPARRVWLDDIDEGLGRAGPATPPPSPSPIDTRAPALPFFSPPGEPDDDKPLIRLPAVPRAPLSVRKTPDTPRARALSKPSPRVDVEPVLQFADETAPLPDLRLRDEPGGAVSAPTSRPGSARAHAMASGAGARLGAALIDHLILFAIDAAVVYFTLRIATLPLSEWRMLPPLPMLAFLGLVKFAYFCAFTAVGGQTIGKMALAIRVVTAEDGAVGGVCAHPAHDGRGGGVCPRPWIHPGAGRRRSPRVA